MYFQRICRLRDKKIVEKNKNFENQEAHGPWHSA